jgi:DNA polymerase-1
LPTPALYIIDGSSYIFRAYYAIRPLSTSTGIPTNAVYGFATMMLKLLREREPEYFAVAFDPPTRSTRRKQAYPEYKANRPGAPDDLVTQMALVRELVRAFNVPALEVEGYEADDVIGALTRRAQERGLPVFIVSSDKDLMQLVSGDVHLLDTMKDKEIGPAEVRERFGVEPAQMVEVLALMGDTSDNIPGIPGVGEKTAAELVRKYGSVENLLAHADEVPGEKRREAIRQHAEQALLARELARLDTDVRLPVNVEDLRRRPPHTAELAALLGRLEFSSLLRELQVEPPGGARAKEGERPAVRLLLSPADLEGAVARCAASGGFAVQALTTEEGPMRAALVGVALAWGEAEGAYVPIGHRYLGVPKQLPTPEVMAALRPLLEDPRLPKHGWNAKQDYLVFGRAGATLNPIAMDVMVAAYLLDPGRPSYKLAELAREHLGYAMQTPAREGGRGKPAPGPDEIEVEAAAGHAVEAAAVIYRLQRHFGPLIRDAGLERLHLDVELPLVRVLALMEREGVRVDTAILAELGRRFDEIARRTERRIFELAGVEFNINSPKQLQEVLFRRLGLQPGKKTETGFSTDVAVLEQLAAEHPLPREVLEYRSVTKLKSTYVNALPELVDSATGRIHTSYNQAVAATGRLSSSDPNLQNIPIRTELGREIRRAFVADRGRVLLSADYSQIELRLLAHASGDATLRDAFRQGEDIHARTAAEVFGVPRAEVTPEMRTSAKAINFGIIYGMGAFRLGRELGIPQARAQAYIDSYLGRLPGVRRYLEETLEGARRDGFVRTLLGRRRFVPDIHSKNRNLRAAAERIAVNAPLQGSAADLIKLAMVRIQRAMEEARRPAGMILQVHDELVFEVPEGEVEGLSRMVQREMEGVAALEVPLRVDLRTGRNWAEAHA